METRQKMETNVHAPQEKPASVRKKRYSWAYSWTWLHNVALLDSVAAALSKSTRALKLREEEKKWMGGCLPGMIENHDVRCSNVFFQPLKSKIDSLRRRKRKF